MPGVVIVGPNDLSPAYPFLHNGSIVFGYPRGGLDKVQFRPNDNQDAPGEVALQLRPCDPACFRRKFPAQFFIIHGFRTIPD
ncbi:hypothetical protein sS8_1357 [Methylocaldum marinum]|uniref:Uncharacterized protein n=1 Tax=Methylocaldum marinum TaxID=1432792 RepID=A0A250KP22_9GAMM|nr:hypothetical protein sS8_1357 [Methylocaldum marinum]